MEGRFKIESILTKEVLYDLGAEMCKKEKIIARIFLVGSSILNIIYCIWLKIRVPEYSVSLENIILILFIIILAWKLDKLNGYIYMLFYGKKALGKKQELFFYDDYLIINSKTNSSYSEIEKVIQTEKGFIIMYNRFVVWVANDSFIIGDSYEFRKFLQQKFKGKVELSKTFSGTTFL